MTDITYTIPEHKAPAADLADRLALVRSYLLVRAHDTDPDLAAHQFLKEDANAVAEAILFLDALAAAARTGVSPSPC